MINADVQPLRRRFSPPILVGGALAWLGLTGVGPEAWPSWVIGAPCIALAAWLAPAATGRRPGVLAALRFAAALMAEIFISATAVARVTLRRRMDVSPGIVRYALGLRDAAAQAVFMNAVTLTPGTLSAMLEPDGTLRVHALDVREDVTGALRVLEARVATLFDLPPPAPAAAP